MAQLSRDRRVLDPLPAAVPDIGRALAALEDARRRTLAVLDGIDAAVLAWSGLGGNSINALLYHVALIELDYLCVEVLELNEFPAELMARFPYDVREASGRLTAVPPMEIASHLERLATMRGRLLAAFETMTPADYRRVRRLPHYDMTPEFVLHHLGQHEAEHRGEIGVLRRMAEQTTAAPPL